MALSDFQNKLLSLLEYFHKYCCKHKLTYYVVFGTMLGAVRHNGFIPWDDDIDVTMPREDYNKLKKLMKDNKDGYIFETASDGNKDFGYAFGKFYDAHTTLCEKSALKPKRGLYLDVFQLDDAGNTYREAEALYKKIFLTRVILQSRLFPVKKGRGLVKNTASVLARLIPFYSPNRKAVKLDKMAASNEGKGKYKAIYLGSEDCKHAVLKKEIYGKPTLYKFENIKVYGPEMGEKYLKCVFGNWKKLPPEEERVIRHEFIELDLNKSYLEEK